MFYKFNQITQRISSAAQEMSMGQSMNLKAAEPAEIHYEYRVQADAAAIKHQAKVKSGYPVPNTPRYRKLMEQQSRFSLQDGKLVWQKLPRDMPMYYVTIALVTVGIGLTVYSLKTLATPPKNE